MVSAISGYWQGLPVPTRSVTVLSQTLLGGRRTGLADPMVDGVVDVLVDPADLITKQTVKVFLLLEFSPDRNFPNGLKRARYAPWLLCTPRRFSSSDMRYLWTRLAQRAFAPSISSTYGDIQPAIHRMVTRPPE